MNRLSRYQRVDIVKALVEGNSIRATCRMTGAAKGTVLKLLADIGPVGAAWEDDHNVNLNSERVQCDEIWSFVYAKEKNVPQDMMGEMVGDVWTWTAIDADTKLVINWTIGMLDADTALDFMDGVAKRLKNRVQLTTEGHHSYLSAVALASENNIDSAQLVEKYGGGHGDTPETRDSPGVCMGPSKEPRLTSAFSKKADNLAYAVALHFLYYNWARPHQTLKGKTPAMAAGLTDRVWTIEDIVLLLEDSEARRANLKNSRWSS